jgi:hypothetical protein
LSKNVFIFGAGASKAESAPVTSELLPKAFERFPDDKRIRHLRKFIKDLFDTDFQDSNSVPSFEDVLGLLDTALQRQECFSKKWNRAQIPILREDLMYAVCQILHEQLRERGTIHRTFMQNLVNHTSFVPDKYSFLNLNYDLLLDNVIADQRTIRNLDLDYGIDFRNFDVDWFRPRKEQAILLLKLHGSLNWIWCPTCNSVKVGRGKKIVLDIWTEFTECDNDHTLQEPLILLPAWFKSYDNPHISTIWLTAEKTLREAERVFFVGCSLRESDTRVKYLLRKSLFRPDGPSVTVVVVDKRRDWEDREDEAAGEKIKSAFKMLFGEIDYQPVGFESFARDLHQYL